MPNLLDNPTITAADYGWAAYSHQKVWHYYTDITTALCGQRIFPLGMPELAPEDLTGQMLCRACEKRLAAREKREARLKERVKKSPQERAERLESKLRKAYKDVEEAKARAATDS